MGTRTAMYATTGAKLDFSAKDRDEAEGK